MTCSISRRGNCHDSAVTEAFFSTVKSEIGEWFASRGDAKADFFTTSRCSISSVVGTRSPAE
jgi:transposase InsO family protein